MDQQIIESKDHLANLKDEQPESCLSLAEINELENHYLWLADQFKPFFAGHSITPLEKLNFLCVVLENQKYEITNLTIDWGKCVPLLHAATLIYHERIEGFPTRKKVRDTSNTLMVCMAHLAQSGNHRSRMVDSFSQQLHNIRGIIRAKYKDQEGAVQQAGVPQV